MQNRRLVFRVSANGDSPMLKAVITVIIQRAQKEPDIHKVGASVDPVFSEVERGLELCGCVCFRAVFVHGLTPMALARATAIVSTTPGT